MQTIMSDFQKERDRLVKRIEKQFLNSKTTDTEDRKRIGFLSKMTQAKLYLSKFRDTKFNNTICQDCRPTQTKDGQEQWCCGECQHWNPIEALWCAEKCGIWERIEDYEDEDLNEN